MKAYVEAVWSLPALQQRVEAARVASWAIAEEEV
jgi:hypothetical protein